MEEKSDVEKEVNEGHIQDDRQEVPKQNNGRHTVLVVLIVLLIILLMLMFLFFGFYKR